jgi:hypothetical protein
MQHITYIVVVVDTTMISMPIIVLITPLEAESRRGCRLEEGEEHVRAEHFNDTGASRAMTVPADGGLR